MWDARLQLHDPIIDNVVGSADNNSCPTDRWPGIDTVNEVDSIPGLVLVEPKKTTRMLTPILHYLRFFGGAAYI